MTKRDFWKYTTRVHKWAGLIIGIQILLWFASGFFMSFFAIESVRGEHLVDKTPPALLAEDLAPIEQAIVNYDGTVSGFSLIRTMDRPAYKIEGTNGRLLLDARTADPLPDLDQSPITIAAQQYYVGTGTIKSLQKLEIAPIDYRGDLPVWQVKFEDRAKTRLYLDPQTAELRSTRTRLWRVFDFMWMLHIMDYNERSDINKWWLKLASLFALLFAISGFFLLAHRFWLRPRANVRD